MTDFLFKSRFSYRREYILRGGRKPKSVFLNDDCFVTVGEIEPGAAPVAYTLSSLDLDDPREKHEIRAFAGSLWWPVWGASGPLQASDFRALVENDWNVASAILDPMHRTYRFHGLTADEYFKDIVIREKGSSSTWTQQVAKAHRDASRIIFCQGRVLVDAGEPVWYVVPSENARDDLDLLVGHSSLDWRESAGYFTPGPQRHVRLASAFHGRAFGLAEIEAATDDLIKLSGRICVRSKIVSTFDRPAVPAAELCARALAEHLWDIAWMHPDLRKAMPAVALARHPDPAPEMLPYREILEQLISLQDTYLKRNLAHLRDHAREILGRLRTVGAPSLAEEDDAALAALSV
jgi:hypothetical protein